MSTALNEALLQEALRKIGLKPPLELALVSRSGAVCAWRVAATAESPANGAPEENLLAAEIARRVHESWENTQGLAQIQFLPPQRSTPELLLYTQALAEPYFLTLAAEPQTGISRLRAVAHEVVDSLTRLQRTPAGAANDISVTVLLERPFDRSVNPEHAFAIAWRPRKPLPAALHGPLTQAVERIAGANACQIAHLSVRPTVIQLVVACPNGKSSAWVAHTFKRGSQLEIQRQFNIPATLWADGYFARESLEPLEPAELQLFLTA